MFVLNNYSLDWRKPLVNLQSSEKVDSHKYHQFFPGFFMEKRVFRCPYSTVFIDITLISVFWWFRLFTFEVIIYMLVIPFSMFFVFCFFLWFLFLCFSLLAFLWVIWTFVRILSWFIYSTFEYISLYIINSFLNGVSEYYNIDI